MVADDTLFRVCKKCGVGVLDESEPARIKNCVQCRAEKRAKVGLRKASGSSALRKVGNLEGKAKDAGRKKVLEEGGRGKRKRRVFKTCGELCEELRSEAYDAHYERYLLEFDGLFESVGGGSGGVKEQVKMVTEELVGIHLLYEELVSEGRSYSLDGSSYTTVYPCDCGCQPRGSCCGGQVQVVAEVGKAYDNGVVCLRTSVRVWHG